MRSLESRWVAARVAAVAMLAWSCAALPTEPTSAAKSRTPEFVRVPVGAAGSFAAAGGGSSSSKQINGAIGGTFSQGHFTLIVPPGAILGNATLTITVPDPSVMHCELSISPPEANRFVVPVRLVADCGTAANLSAWAMQTLWFDEVNNQWVVVPGSSVDAAAATINTPLAHFSAYGVVDGKAGW